MSEFTPTPGLTLESCLEEFDLAIDVIKSEAITPIPQADIDNFKTNLTSMLRDRLSPEEFFSCIGFGSFKECYPAIGDWVVKFAADYNDTDAERAILNAAEEAGLSMLFLPTIFIDLPEKLPIVHADRGGFSYYYDDAPHSYGCSCGECPSRRHKTRTDGLITAILQPRAITSSSNSVWVEIMSSEQDYNKNPLHYQTGEDVSFALYSDLDISSHTWLQAVIDVYGDKVFDSFHRFCNQCALSDLHEDNTGYLETPQGVRPVLLDWLSRYSN